MKKDLFKLQPYQIECVDKGLMILKEYRLVYLSMEMRTGKSLTSLTIAKVYGAKNILFLTKKNAIKSVEADVILSGYDINVLVTNYEQAANIKQAFDLIILDESNEKISAFPKMGTYAKLVKVLCKNKPLIFCSGTSTPESFSQLFHQIQMSSWSPFIKYKNFYQWAKDYVNVKQKMIGGFMINDYSDGIEEKILSDTKHLFVSLTQKEAGFTDEIVDVVHRVQMSDTTKKLIRKIKKDKLIEGKTETYVADTAAKEMQGVHQLGSGTLKVNDEVSVTIDTSKVTYIKEKFKGLKIAIFYNFIQEGVMLKEAFTNWTDNDKSFNDNSDLVYIGQVVSKRSGVSLKTADCLIFLSVPFSATSYLQARSRHAHKDRKTSCEVHFLLADCGIDGHVYKTVKEKKKFTTAHFRRSNYE